MSEVSPEERLWDLMRGTLTARALALVADLCVADALAGGPRPVAEVAREVGADADTLHRLLRALASDGIFAEEEERGVFRNTPASDLLRASGWGDFAHLFGGIWHRAVGELEATGAPTFPQVFGADFWPWLADHPADRAAFDRAMEQGKEQRVERLAELEWRGDETVVDVGGGNGSLLVQLLHHHPGLRGIVFDLPETNRDEAALGDRIEFVAGNFFESVPPGDVYVLSTILHDWPDEQALQILRTIHAAAPPHARLLVVDSVIPAGNEPHGGKWLDLLMLTLFAGRERDEQQWRVLLDAGGFEPVCFHERLIEAQCQRYAPKDHREGQTSPGQ
jgi:O-methyltransferase/methyltransferase family protein